MVEKNKAKTNTEKTQEKGIVKLELFDGDAIGFCDVETGVCSVPEPVEKANAIDEQSRSTSNERADTRRSGRSLK